MEKLTSEEIYQRKIEKLERELKSNRAKVESIIKVRTEKLKLSEQKFRLLFEKSSDPILIIDGFEFLDCNKAALKTLGFKKKSDIYKLHPSMLSPKYQPDGRLSDEKANEMISIAYKKSHHQFEWTHLDGNKKEIKFDVILNKIPYKGKEMIFMIWRDISKQKEYEHDIIESEKRYSSLFEQAADGILVGIVGGEIVNANSSISKLTGYRNDELIGNNINILFQKDELVGNPLQYDLVKKGDTVINERNIVRKNGSLIPIEMNTKILDDGRMQSLFRDISKRKKAERDLKESEEKYRNIFHHSPLGIFHFDINGVITDCNDYFCEIIGTSKQELLGFNMLQDLKNTKIIHCIQESLINGESSYEDWYTSIKAKKNTFVRILFKSIKNSDQNIISGTGLVENITERKEIEQRIFNAVIETEEKERARLASDIHDEIGPLLSSLKMYIESLHEKNDTEKQNFLKKQSLSLIKETIANVREISNALSPYILIKYGLGLAVRSFLENSKDLIKITFKTNLNNERFPINVETVYYRIIKELLNNTIKHAEADCVDLWLNYTNKNLLLTYKDNGKGIEIEHLKELEQKGNGLLNITNRINSINGNYWFLKDQKPGFKFQMSRKLEILKK